MHSIKASSKVRAICIQTKEEKSAISDRGDRKLIFFSFPLYIIYMAIVSVCCQHFSLFQPDQSSGGYNMKEWSTLTLDPEVGTKFDYVVNYHYVSPIHRMFFCMRVSTEQENKHEEREKGSGIFLHSHSLALMVNINPLSFYSITMLYNLKRENRK